MHSSSDSGVRPAATAVIGAVVMASGESRRFGSNKLLADLNGQPVLSYILKNIQSCCHAADLPFQLAPVAVTRSVQVQDLCKTYHFPCLFHDLPGLNDTIRLGLTHLLEHGSPDRSLEACLFFQGDQPLLSADSIRHLLLSHQRHPDSIIRLSWQGTPGSPVIFPASLYPELLCLPPDRGGNVIIRKYPQRVLLAEAVHASELLDADTPEALARIRESALSSPMLD